VILYLSFEELTALRSGIEHVLEADALAGHGIAAPPQIVADLEQLAPQLNGDITIETLDQQRRTRASVAYLLHEARVAMDQYILEQHAAAETAVAAYFDYAHVLNVLHKLDRMYEEMAALVQIVTGNDPDSDAARRFSFPD
jgi:hypothetical protein